MGVAKLIRAFRVMGALLIGAFVLAGASIVLDGLGTGDTGMMVRGLATMVFGVGAWYSAKAAHAYRTYRSYRGVDVAQRDDNVWEGRVTSESTVETRIDQETVPAYAFRVLKRRKKEVSSTLGTGLVTEGDVLIESSNGAVKLTSGVAGDLMADDGETASNKIMLTDDVPLMEVSGDSDTEHYDDPVDRRTAAFINEVFGTQHQGPLSGVTYLTLEEQPLQEGEMVHIFGAMRREEDDYWHPVGEIDLRRGSFTDTKEALREKLGNNARKAGGCLVILLVLAAVGSVI